MYLCTSCFCSAPHRQTFSFLSLVFSYKIPGAAGGGGEKVKRKWRCSYFTILALIVWSTIIYVTDIHTRLQSPFTCRCTAVQDASLLNSTIIRSESAGRTGEMRKRTNTHAHGRPQGSGGNFFITPSEAHGPLWNKDIYDCLPFGKSKPAGFWLAVIVLCIRLLLLLLQLITRKHTLISSIFCIFPPQHVRGSCIPPFNKTCSCST